MARNCNPFDRIRERLDRLDAKNRGFSGFQELRRRLYRSRNGKVLGVFRGIAESMGFSVCWTRVIGCFLLLTLTDFFGAHGLMVTLLVGGFFYLLAALLMQAPREGSGIPVPAGSADPDDDPSFRPQTRYGRPYPTAVPFQQVRPRVDLAQLDRQLDSLNHRIQRMETIVTDRQYDWDRRMES